MNQTRDKVVAVLIDALLLEEAPDGFGDDTALFGSLPELDSMGVVALVVALEDEFDIMIDDTDFGAELFETLGSLTRFVESKTP